MILVDNKSGRVEPGGRDSQKEILVHIHRTGCKAELTSLEFGDAAFEGNGPNGKILIGIERKTIGDMLNCIDDSRYSAHQRPGMMAMYQKSILIIEGVWKPDITTGYLMECINTLSWRVVKQRTQMARYNKLFRYLLTVQFSGVTVIWSRDMEQTAYNITEIFHWFQKPWDQHTSLLEMQKLNIPALTGRPKLVQRWAAEIDGIGVKHSQDAVKVFKTPYDLARSDETEWITLPGVGAKLARSVIKQIHGDE
jgi:ERCC4-type nuclease